MFITIGQAKDPCKLKVKVVLQPVSFVDVFVGSCFGALQTLLFVRSLAYKFVTMDRGHRHSNGCSKILFLDSNRL